MEGDNSSTDGGGGDDRNIPSSADVVFRAGELKSHSNEKGDSAVGPGSNTGSSSSGADRQQDDVPLEEDDDPVGGSDDDDDRKLPAQEKTEGEEEEEGKQEHQEKQQKEQQQQGQRENEANSTADAGVASSVTTGGAAAAAASVLVSSSPPPPSSFRKRKGKPEKSNHQLRWDEMYSRLCDYHKRYGNANVPNRYADDPQLGSWVSAQRRAYKTITSGATGSTAMTLDRATKLKQLGFEWEAVNPNNVPWETRYNELLAFVKKYGHANVPMRWKENVQLSNWVSKQRHDYKLLHRGTSSRLTERRQKLLNDVNFVWEVERGSSIAQLQRVSVVGLPSRKARRASEGEVGPVDDGEASATGNCMSQQSSAQLSHQQTQSRTTEPSEDHTSAEDVAVRSNNIAAQTGVERPTTSTGGSADDIAMAAGPNARQLQPPDLSGQLAGGSAINQPENNVTASTSDAPNSDSQLGTVGLGVLQQMLQGARGNAATVNSGVAPPPMVIVPIVALMPQPQQGQVTASAAPVAPAVGGANPQTLPSNNAAVAQTVNALNTLMAMISGHSAAPNPFVAAAPQTSQAGGGGLNPSTHLATAPAAAGPVPTAVPSSIQLFPPSVIPAPVQRQIPAPPLQTPVPAAQQFASQATQQIPTGAAEQLPTPAVLQIPAAPAPHIAAPAPQQQVPAPSQQQNPIPPSQQTIAPAPRQIPIPPSQQIPARAPQQIGTPAEPAVAPGVANLQATLFGLASALGGGTLQQPHLPQTAMSRLPPGIPQGTIPTSAQAGSAATMSSSRSAVAAPVAANLNHNQSSFASFLGPTATAASGTNPGQQLAASTLASALAGTSSQIPGLSFMAPQAAPTVAPPPGDIAGALASTLSRFFETSPSQPSASSNPQQPQHLLAPPQAQSRASVPAPALTLPAQNLATALSHFFSENSHVTTTATTPPQQQGNSASANPERDEPPNKRARTS